MKELLILSILIVLGLAPAHVAAQDDPRLKQDQQPQKHLATLHGRVVDARTGEAIAKVRVIANDTEQSTTTDENGSFLLENLPAGEVELYITTVSFGLVKKTITLKEGDNSDIQIALNEDAAALTEKVTVVGNPFESTETLAVTKNFFLGERVRTELRVEFDNVLNRMRVCGGDHMDNDPYNVSGLDPNNTKFSFGIVSAGAVCQGNTPRRGQAVLRITF